MGANNANIAALLPTLAYISSAQGGGVTALDPSAERQPIKLLDMKHPEYEARFEAWLDLSLLYEGGAALKARSERILKKRPREDEEVYAARMDHFTYQNILGTGLGWYGAAMFDEAPEIFFNGKPGDKDWTEFLSNCDGVGTTFVDFFKRVFQILLTYGAGWILTDLKALQPGDPQPLSLADERQRGLLDPHLVGYSPLNVINWQFDEFGKLKWAVVKTETQQQRFLRDPEMVSTWYYYDEEKYVVYEDRRAVKDDIQVAVDDSRRFATFLREGRHSLSHVGRPPIRKIILSEGLWLANRAYLLLMDHVNQDNALMWGLFMSALAIPIVIGDVDPSSMTYAETGYLQFPAGTQYMWSEPEGKSFAICAKRVDSLREESFRSMNLQAQGRSMRATPAMQSGRSKILEMAPAKQTLNGMGDDLRKSMQDVLTDVKDARRERDTRPDVRGFNYQDDMTTEEVFAVSSVLNMRIPSRRFEKYVQKKVAKAWMVDANREELVKVYEEIEAGPTMEEQEQKDQQDRMKMAKSSMQTALAARASAGPEMPPGRGGGGPSPSAKDGSGEGKGKEKEK